MEAKIKGNEVLKRRYVSIVGFVCVFIFALLLNVMVHREALDPALRYAQVAEGNISHAVYRIFSSGIKGFCQIIQDDAGNAGRIRPVHWLFHSVSFMLALIANGDLSRNDSSVPWYDRMNGDLLVHTWYLLCCIAVSIASLAWVGFKMLHTRWFLVFFPLIYLNGAVYLSENLLVNFCDSGEIGQLLFISLHLLAICSCFKREALPPIRETAASILIVLALFMKETTLVYAGVIALALLLCGLVDKRGAPERRRFLFRHAAVMMAASLMLIVFIWLNKTKGYSGNYELNAGFMSRMLSSWNNMSLLHDQIRYVLVALLFFLIPTVFSRLRAMAAGRALPPDICLALIAASLWLGFWVINLPWAFQMVKYYLPAYTFLSFTCVTCALSLYDYLKTRGLTPSAYIWVLGSVVFLMQSADSRMTRTKEYYKSAYEIRKTAFKAAADMANLYSPRAPISVQLLDGQAFQERRLLFCRLMNRVYGANIIDRGQVVHSIRSSEQNYFRKYPDAVAYDIGMLNSNLEMMRADYIYVWAFALENEQVVMRDFGYHLLREWAAGSPGRRVGVYVRQ